MMPATLLEWIMALIGLFIGVIYAFDGWTGTSAAKSLKDSPRLVNLKYAIGAFFVALVADFTKIAQFVDLKNEASKGQLLLLYVSWFLVTALLGIIAVAGAISFQFQKLTRECQGIQFPGIHPVLHFLAYGYRAADEQLKLAKENWSDAKSRFIREFLPHYNTQLTRAIVAVNGALHATNPASIRLVAGAILQNVEAVVKVYNQDVAGLKVEVNYMRAQPSGAVDQAVRDGASFMHGKWEDYAHVLILEQYAGDPAPPLFVLPVWKTDGGKAHVLPGAPQAFFNNGDVLVNDTKKDLEYPSNLPSAMVKEINHYFGRKSFKSFVSMSIINNRAPCGVLNIEANQVNVFGQGKQAQEEIVKMLKPFCHLLGFLIRT